MENVLFCVFLLWIFLTCLHKKNFQKKNYCQFWHEILRHDWCQSVNKKMLRKVPLNAFAFFSIIFFGVQPMSHVLCKILIARLYLQIKDLIEYFQKVSINTSGYDITWKVVERGDWNVVIYFQDQKTKNCSNSGYNMDYHIGKFGGNLIINHNVIIGRNHLLPQKLQVFWK